MRLTTFTVLTVLLPWSPSVNGWSLTRWLHTLRPSLERLFIYIDDIPNDMGVTVVLSVGNVQVYRPSLSTRLSATKSAILDVIAIEKNRFMIYKSLQQGTIIFLHTVYSFAQCEICDLCETPESRSHDKVTRMTRLPETVLNHKYSARERERRKTCKNTVVYISLTSSFDIYRITCVEWLLICPRELYMRRIPS